VIANKELDEKARYEAEEEAARVAFLAEQTRLDEEHK
jgi:hypothetical protein